MSKYRTAMGRTLDMGVLRARNQNVRAVGNMNVDAAGNTLDSNNEVISDSAKRVNQVYGKTTVNPGAAPRGRALPPETRNTANGRPQPQPQHSPPPMQHLSPLQRKLQADQAARQEGNPEPQSVEPPVVPPPVVQAAPTPPPPATPPSPARGSLQPDGPGPAPAKTPSTPPSPFIEDGAASQAELEQLTEWDEELPVEKSDPSATTPATTPRARRR